MSQHDVARAREMIVPGVTNHSQLIQKLKRLSSSFDLIGRNLIMIWITRNLTSQMQKLANFIALEGRTRSAIGADAYTNDICAHWRFVDETIARKSSAKIYSMFCEYRDSGDFIGMDMARKFLEMGFTRARRYANHSSGKKYAKNGTVRPQETDALHNVKAKSARIFKEVRDKAAYDSKYQQMRKQWRSAE